MSFKPQNFTLWSQLRDTAPAQLPQWWGYFTADDNMATVSASAYFNTDPTLVIDFTNIRLNDFIYAACTDGIIQLQVTAITPNVTTALPPAEIAAGTITTAMLGANIVTAAKIANGAISDTQVNAAAAIAFSKLAALASGNIIVGSVGTVPTSVPMSGDVAIIASGATTIQAAAVTSAKLDPQTIQYIKVPMTASQWNNMYTTPIEIIPAPGANKAVIVRGMVASMTFVSAQYTGGGAIILQYDSAVNHGAGSNACGAGTAAAATVNAFAASSSFGLVGQVPVAGIANSTFVNKNVAMSNATGVFATGDGTWQVHVWYEIVTL